MKHNPSESEVARMIDKINRGIPTLLETSNARTGKSETEKKTEAAFREVRRDEPEIVAKTRRKSGKAAAEAQRTAIALSKARRAGAKIPKRTSR